MNAPRIDRHRTAIGRAELSRPLRLAIEDEVITPDLTVFDYGCGRGGDVAKLSQAGISASGWDPVHAPGRRKRPAQVVNLGYVLNVIESEAERVEALRQAWKLAQRVLIVSARLRAEEGGLEGRVYKDGLLTNRNTFQKFYEQSELRGWIETELEAPTLPAGPGVIYAFRERDLLEEVRARRYFTRSLLPRRMRAGELFAENREELAPLLEFAEKRGRLPTSLEIGNGEALRASLGSLRRALAIVRTAVGEDRWKAAGEQRAADLLLYLALAQFDGQPKFNDLSIAIQRDVKAFFGSYRSASQRARAFLLSAGDTKQREEAMQQASVGKLTQAALYIHVSAINHLPLTLRAYEGCARAFLGTVQGATVVKLARDGARVSYLFYPGFEREPHPALFASLSLNLSSFRMKIIRYDTRMNPPILHRKEEFVSRDSPLRRRFERLTRQEERFGLYDDARAIGTRKAWQALIDRKGLTYRGHRLVQAD